MTYSCCYSHRFITVCCLDESNIAIKIVSKANGHTSTKIKIALEAINKEKLLHVLLEAFYRYFCVYRAGL